LAERLSYPTRERGVGLRKNAPHFIVVGLRLTENFFDHSAFLDASQSLVESLVGEGEALVVDAE
jgi:hypothetical protein